ncbi:MAG: hypothetical protein R3C99_19540 [Pirellulaceae bacterium]
MSVNDAMDKIHIAHAKFIERLARGARANGKKAVSPVVDVDAQSNDRQQEHQKYVPWSYDAVAVFGIRRTSTVLGGIRIFWLNARGLSLRAKNFWESPLRT